MEIFEEYEIVGKKLHINITYQKLNELVPWLNLSTRLDKEKRLLILNFLPGNIVVINDPNMNEDDEIYNVIILDLNKNPSTTWLNLYDKMSCVSVCKCV